MSLAKHIDTATLIDSSKDHPIHKHKSAKHTSYSSPYLSRYNAEQDLPKYQIPQEGVDEKTAARLLKDELDLDAQVNMNLASFVHTWMPEEGVKLMESQLFVNMSDQDEYPSMTAIHQRCVSQIAHLWHAPPADSGQALGTATTGSSEGIMLGGLAMKKRWQAKMKAAGKDECRPGPNIIMGNEAQVCLEKFARYFDVETRLVPVSVESDYVMTAKECIKQVDENTIGVFVILGSTFTGHFENVKEISDALDEYEARTGIHIPIHVDAASGGFFAPFAYPDYVWDFRLPRVCSINASGHKYGMSAVGVGWVVWREESLLPKELIFELHYLGATDYSYTLNFSRPAHPIIGQAFNFLNLGFEGYRRIMQGDLKKARLLSRALENSGHYKVLSDIHRAKTSEPAGAVAAVERSLAKVTGGKVSFNEDDAEYYKEGLPVVSFRFTDEIKQKYPGLKQAWMQHQLRGIGWIVPNYALPPNVDNLEILRVVIRESFSMNLVDKLIEDILTCTENLLKGEGPSPEMAKLKINNDELNKKASADKVEEAAKKVEKVLHGQDQNNQGTWGRAC